MDPYFVKERTPGQFLARLNLHHGMHDNFY